MWKEYYVEVKNNARQHTRVQIELHNAEEKARYGRKEGKGRKEKIKGGKRCCTVQYNTIQCNTIKDDKTQYNAVQQIIEQYNMVDIFLLALS